MRCGRTSDRQSSNHPVSSLEAAVPKRSSARLPDARVPAEVRDGEDYRALGFDDEEHAEGKAEENGAFCLRPDFHNQPERPATSFQNRKLRSVLISSDQIAYHDPGSRECEPAG